MTTTARTFFAVYLTSTLVFAGATMNSFASGQHEKTHAIIERSGNAEDFDHVTLARQYEKLAKDMQANINEQQTLLSRKLGYGNFKKNGWRFKSRAAYKIRGYKKAAQEYLKKAAYHHKMAAEKAKSKSVTEQNPINRTGSPI